MASASPRAQSHFSAAVGVHDEHISALHPGPEAEAEPAVGDRGAKLKVYVSGAREHGGFWYTPAKAEVCIGADAEWFACCDSAGGAFRGKTKVDMVLVAEFLEMIALLTDHHQRGPEC